MSFTKGCKYFQHSNDNMNQVCICVLICVCMHVYMYIAMEIMSAPQHGSPIMVKASYCANRQTGTELSEILDNAL